MGKMKNIEIELHNSSELIKYIEHRITVLEKQLLEANTQIKGLSIIAKELLTAVDLKHLDKEVKE